MGAPKEEIEKKLTFRKYQEGVHEYERLEIGRAHV